MREAPFQPVVPNEDIDIREFAEAAGISVERARYIESMRHRYLLWEHDYVKGKEPTGRRRSQLVKR